MPPGTILAKLVTICPSSTSCRSSEYWGNWWQRARIHHVSVLYIRELEGELGPLGPAGKNQRPQVGFWCDVIAREESYPRARQMRKELIGEV